MLGNFAPVCTERYLLFLKFDNVRAKLKKCLRSHRASCPLKSLLSLSACLSVCLSLSVSVSVGLSCVRVRARALSRLLLSLLPISVFFLSCFQSKELDQKNILGLSVSFWKGYFCQDHEFFSPPFLRRSESGVCNGGNMSHAIGRPSGCTCCWHPGRAADILFSAWAGCTS